MRKTLRFLSQAVTVGLAAAVVLLLLLPKEQEQRQPVVEITQAGAPAPAGAANGQGPALGEGPVSYAAAVARASPAVVNIHTAKVVTERVSPLFKDPLFRHLFGDRLGTPRHRLETSLGSGVIVSDSGFVLTNHHVVKDADQIRVMLEDGRSTDASVVGTNPESDVSVLKIELDELPAITLGDSESLQVGDVVLAIGNPFGVGQTVTMGIVSATGRAHLGLNVFENFIQTDAAINPGNSGGALINPYGQLVGINTAIFSKTGGSQGIGFAIPVSLARGVMEQIIETGRVSRGWLGIEIQSISRELARSFDLPGTDGVIVAGVLRGGPADEAGIEPGDVITHVQGKPVQGPRATLKAISATPPGGPLQVRILRRGQARELVATVSERPAAAE